MPNEQEHLKKVANNERFIASLDLTNNVNAEWAITALFYAAVHRVEASLAKVLGYHSNTHDDRKRSMATVSGMKGCFPDYRHLETLSRNCRYGIVTFTKRDYDKARPCFDRLTKQLP
jgi:hypothetical protein